MVIATALNIPKILEIDLTMNSQTEPDIPIMRNQTVPYYETTEPEYKTTLLRKDSNYIYYYTHLTKLFFTGVIPFVYLFFTNIYIAIKIKKSKKFRPEEIRMNLTKESIRSNQDKKEETSRQSLRRFRRKESSRSANASFITLAAIVVLYIVCNTPRLLINMMEYLGYLDLEDINCHNIHLSWVELFLRVSDLLPVINSAVNFVIYFFVSKTFKKVLLVKFRLVKVRPNIVTDTTFAQCPDVNGEDIAEEYI